MQTEPEIDKPKGFVIKEMFLPTNKGMHMGIRGNHQIKYLVIHYTAGGNSREGAAASNRNVFLTRNASADFCIDDKTIVQCNPDPLKYYCWAVGDGKGKYGINNYDCISIEMCSNLKKGTTAKVPNHEGWYLTDEVINNTILTCKYRNYSYEYTFDKDNKLIKIFNSYSFNSEDKTVYEDTLNTYISRSKDINNMGGNSKVINDDENNTFVFENIIDKEIDLSSIDVNYFVLSSNYNDVLNQLSGKGFDCK